MDSVIAAKYRTIRRAGRGGMGVVYHAQDLTSGADVALKVVTVTSVAERRRVTREAAVLSSLEHPAIVRYLDHGTLPDGDTYLAMEWMGGETLEDRLGAGELGVRDAIELGIRLAEALGHAHRQGVVHRDLKPSNVILGRLGLADAKLIDFGVARGAAPSQSQIVTQAGMIVGTPGYMAPEQARAEPDIDARADVFALGCLLFRCLAGRPAYTGKDGVDLLLRVAQGAADALGAARPDLPSPIVAAIDAMLAPARDDRPSNGLAAAALLRIGLESAPRDSTTQQALTGAEQRLVTIVAGTSRDVDVWNDETIREGRGDANGDPLAEVVRGLGLELEALADRTFLVAVTDIEVATDLAARGARVARALRQADPTLRLAVATGLAMRRGGSTHGRPVDVAAGALAGGSTAPVARGDIWLDAVTAGLLDGRAPLETTASGYRLGQVPTSATIVTRRLGAQLPFHGRERELRFLESTFDEALDESAPRAVFVLGEPGIGKSRLVDEALARIQARTPGASLLVASGDVAGKSSPFALVAEAVRRSADVYRDETDEEQHEKLRARVARSFPDAFAASRVDEVTAKLAMLIGLEVAPPSRRGSASGPEALHKGDLMRRAFVDLVAADADRGPVIVLLEDLQWGDLPSLQAIDALMKRLEGRCVWVVAVGRPEVGQLFPGLWSAHGPTTLSVVQLAKKPAERLVRAVLAEPSDEVVASIVERGGGNPLFIEQLVRSAHGGAHGTLPETMLAIVALRLEQLGTAARRTLRAASIFGVSAWQDAVRVLCGADRESPSLRESMDELLAKGLLERRDRSRFGDEEEIAFTSAAVREVAYDTLTPSDRTTGHRLAAEWLEQHGESDAVRLGEQWLRAGERSRAAALFGRAAEQALEGGDFVRCRELATLARENEPDAELRATWACAEAEAFGWAGRFEEMNARAAEALADLRPGSVAWCRAGAALMLLGGGAVPMERLIQIIGSVAFLPLESGASLAEVRIHGIVGMLLYRAGQVELGRTVRDRVLSLDPEAFQSESLVRGWVEMIRTYEGRFAVRHPHLTFASAQRAAAHFEDAYDLRLQALALVDAAYAALALGRFEDCVALASRGGELARAHGADWVNTYGGGVMVGGLARAGRIDEARALGQEMIDLSLRRSDGVNAAFVAHMLAVGELTHGHVAEAEAMVARALGDLGLPPTTTAFARATKARCELRAGRTESALALAREARAASEAACPDIAESWIALALIEALEASGDADGAREERDRARARIEERMVGMTEYQRASFLSVPENATIAAPSP